MLLRLAQRLARLFPSAFWGLFLDFYLPVLPRVAPKVPGTLSGMREVVK
jgi:hypothetical protein